MKKWILIIAISALLLPACNNSDKGKGNNDYNPAAQTGPNSEDSLDHPSKKWQDNQIIQDTAQAH
jgi:hypothetical protein